MIDVLTAFHKDGIQSDEFVNAWEEPFVFFWVGGRVFDRLPKPNPKPKPKPKPNPKPKPKPKP